MIKNSFCFAFYNKYVYLCTRILWNICCESCSWRDLLTGKMTKKNKPLIHNKRRNKIRIHHEGVETLVLGGFVCLGMIVGAFFVRNTLGIVAAWTVAVVFLIVYLILLNFFRCPIRMFQGPTTKSVVAPADGKIVVIEEVEETEYFHDRRLMISIFMSLTNVHANWIPCEGKIVKVDHQKGNFMKAYLPKASTENERSMVVIRTPHGEEVMARQIAGAMARRIVTYSKPGDECFIDDHMGFIKFGSRVDVYLPLGTEVLVEMGQKTVGDETIIARLK